MVSNLQIYKLVPKLNEEDMDIIWYPRYSKHIILSNVYIRIIHKFKKIVF